MDMKKALTCALLTLFATVTVAGSSNAATINDPYYPRQWGLRRIGAPAAWATSQGSGITIAIVDTGVDRTHEDLKTKLVKLQYDGVTGDDFAQDAHGHGTLVAGAAAAATNNKLGIAGVAPKAKIMAVRVFPVFHEDEGAETGAVAGGIMWAADNGAHVINLSLGGLNPQPDVHAAILYATALGSLVVAAAGNESLPACLFPAFNPATLCVGASDQLDGMASFSNYGARLDVVAPGTAIWSTGSIRKYPAPTDPLGKYQAVPGTSIASPMVAGVGALLMSMGADNALAGLIIRASAKDLGLPGYDLTYGFGRLDAKRAVDLCSQLC